jgi:hypothetical protein
MHQQMHSTSEASHVSPMALRNWIWKTTFLLTRGVFKNYFLLLLHIFVLLLLSSCVTSDFWGYQNPGGSTCDATIYKGTDLRTITMDGFSHPDHVGIVFGKFRMVNNIEPWNVQGWQAELMNVTNFAEEYNRSKQKDNAVSAFQDIIKRYNTIGSSGVLSTGQLEVPFVIEAKPGDYALIKVCFDKFCCEINKEFTIKNNMALYIGTFQIDIKDIKKTMQEHSKSRVYTTNYTYNLSIIDESKNDEAIFKNMYPTLYSQFMERIVLASLRPHVPPSVTPHK